MPALPRLLALLLALGFTAVVVADGPAPKPDAPPVAPAGPATHPLVHTERGNCPIIVSAPHGGTARVPDVSLRKGIGMERGGAGFFVGRDGGTEELAADIAAAVKAKTGKRPYLVVARFARTYIDANRPPEVGYEDPDAKPVYDAYHAALTAYCKAVRTEFGCGLLIDIHGQGRAADTIIRGTANGKTVRLLRDRFGEKAHTGPNSLFGLLAANGCKVYPADLTGPEFDGLTGGFITRNYGGDHGVDAQQLEFGSDYRTADHRADTAKKVAAALAAYSDLYLKPTD